VVSRKERIYDGWRGVERSGHEDEALQFDEDAERWAEREREQELIAMLVEAAHLKSAARAWYRLGAPTVPANRPKLVRARHERATGGEDVID
jgi:hypothetical protein